MQKNGYVKFLCPEPAFLRDVHRSLDHQPTRRGFLSTSLPSTEAITGSGTGSESDSPDGLEAGVPSGGISGTWSELS